MVDDAERQNLDKIAKRYRLDPGATAAIEKEFQLPVAQNACGLQAVAHPDAQRALEYLKQGMNYASQRKPEAALDEFQQVLKIDPHYLAIQQNIGLQYAALGRYPEAEKAIHQELDLLTCFGKMTDAQLAPFDYMMETGRKPAGEKRTEQTQTFRRRAQETQAAAHYNLACRFAMQKRARRTQSASSSWRSIPAFATARRWCAIRIWRVCTATRSFWRLRSW
ncbi:MAG: hypothetical protein M3Y07_11230 [Acidobacteriota bacterium]|nr:hypothetical protein [Acidobacteriota bacterium]